MPTPPLTDETCREAWEAFEAHEKRYKSAADSMGLTLNAFRGRIARARERGLHLSDGARHSVNTAGLGFGEARGGHRRVYDDDGRQIDTVRWAAPERTQEDVLDRIRVAFEGITPAPPVAAPEAVMADLCSVYPLMDAHIGMHAWGRETGADDYDIALAAGDMRHAFAKVLAITPASKRGVLIIGGDFFHADDNRAETPASKHRLDVDGRFFKVLDLGIGIISETIERLLHRHAELTVRVLRGNHDPHSSLTLNFALAERYRDEPRVKIEKDPRDLFMLQWGRCAIFAHHGDRGKPQQMALYLSDVCPFWSSTRHRHYLTGHVHHDQSKDFGPLRWESLRAFCPPDSYAAGMGYGARRALQSMTFHTHDGLVLRALDPIERLPEKESAQ